MAEAARHCAAAGYDEINLNIGCPRHARHTHAVLALQ
jgi:tRNA-dihydrouridine synthase